MRRGRLATGSDAPPTGEAFTVFVDTAAVRVEQILSSSTPSGEVYVQDLDEWVVVLQGGALLDVDGEQVELGPGQWLVLPAGVPHRVLRTALGTNWLAVQTPPASR